MRGGKKSPGHMPGLTKMTISPFSSEMVWAHLNSQEEMLLVETDSGTHFSIEYISTAYSGVNKVTTSGTSAASLQPGC